MGMRELICVLRLVFLLLIGSTAAAAVAAPPFGDSLRNVTLWGWSILFIVSTLAGVTALFNRIVNDQKGLLPKPFLFVAAHMSGSWLAGLLVFFLGLGSEMADGYMGVGIALASFGGAKFVEKMAERYLEVRGQVIGPASKEVT